MAQALTAQSAVFKQIAATTFHYVATATLKAPGQHHNYNVYPAPASVYHALLMINQQPVVPALCWLIALTTHPSVTYAPLALLGAQPLLVAFVKLS
jgi:hypothetical protein